MIRHELIHQEFYPGTGWATAYFDLGPEPWIGVRLMAGDVEGLGNPEVESMTRTLGRDGQVYEGWRALPREVYWPVLIDAERGTAEDFQALYDQFWAAMRPASPGSRTRRSVWRVTKPDGTYRELPIRYVGEQSPAMPVDPTVARESFHGVRLVADDPFWRGPEVLRDFQSPTDDESFYGPTGSAPPFYISPGSTAASFEITVPGDGGLTVYPRWRIYGETTGFQLRRGEFSDLVFSSPLTIGPTQYLDVDLDPEVQTAVLFDTATGQSQNVAWDLSWGGQPGVNPTESTQFSLVLNGTGRAEVRYAGRYLKGF